MKNIKILMLIMKYFRLGKLRLSKICLGTWSLGGNKNNFSYGNMNEKQTHKILDYAYIVTILIPMFMEC